MKKQVLVIALVLMTVGMIMITSSISFAQNANEFVVPLSDPAKRCKVKANLNYGSITIKGTARKDILVRYKEGGDNDCEDCDEERDHDHDDKEKSKDGMKRIGGGGMDFEVTENANYVRVRSDSWNNKIDMELEIPSGADVEFSTYNDGDLMITGIQGAVEATNYNGEITALNISGSVVATTYNGEVKVTFDKVTEGAPMSFTTYNGDIDVSFPSTVKASVKMKTEQGEIFTNFDLKITSTGPVKTQNKNNGGTVIKVDDWKRGDVNGGGAEVTMKNYNGDIYLRKK
jgi:DUF4097 and DUF4098 domain-containing protein YvlB